MKTAIPAEPVEIALPYKPLPKQAEFHELSAKYRAFGGGWGNGKTSAGCAEAFALSMEYPGSTGLIARRTRPELKATTEHQFFHGGGGDPRSDWTGCPQEVIRSYNRSENILKLINGSIIHFWPLDDPDKLTNLNLGWFLIDQAEEVPEEMFQMLQGRLRQREAPRCGMILFNPAGHDWIWRRWVYLKYPEHRLVHAKTTDNPNLPPDYIESLMEMPEMWRKRFMEGSFDVFSGQIYPEYDDDVHSISPFPIPDFWEYTEAIDHGHRNPTAILFARYDTQGNCFIVDEHYKANRLVSYHADAVLQKRAHLNVPYPRYSVIDASAAAEDPKTGRSVIDEYRDFGIQVVSSDRHVLAGINRIGEWLRLDPEHPHPLTNETREEGWPRLYIFKNCVNLREHLPQYQWKKPKLQSEEDEPEKPLKKDDHDVDALRYKLMQRPPPAKSPMGIDPNQPQSRYWELIRKRMAGGRDSGHSMLGSEA